MSLPPPVLAFGLVNLPMLGWLAAAAAPILIHLWSRRRYHEVSWAAMEYLMVAVRRQARRLRFEQWLLLLIRTLLIVLIVLAVAEPYLERPGLALAPGGQTHRVLVLDGSYSMAYQPTDKSRFDKAKDFARQIVKNGPQGDGFTLVLMSSPPRVVVGTPAFEPSELLREIDNLQLPHTTADLPATVAALVSLLKNVQQDNPRLTRHEIYFLTDLQRVTWAQGASPDGRSEFLRQSAELAQLASLTVIDLGQPGAENLAITGLRTLDPLPTVGRTVSFEVALKHFGAPTHRRQPVELLIDGRRIAEKQIDLPANGETSLAFTHRFETSGDHVVEARALGDALQVDNHRYLVVPVRESIHVLCIDGRPSGTPFRGAADYLAVALAPQEKQGERGLIRPEVAAESALQERNLGGYDCVFLCNVAQFTAGEARVLDSYLKHGGSLVFFLGDQVLAEGYNHELGGSGNERAGRAKAALAAKKDTASAPHILPARLGGIVEHVPQAPFRLDPLEYRHPIVQAFRGRGESGLLITPVFKHFKLETANDSPAKAVLALANGDPLIVEQPMHRGRVVLVATSADTSWTAMPLWPSFVPLVQEMVAWLVGLQSQQRNVLVGQPIEVSLAAAAEDVPLTLRFPDGRDHKAQLPADGESGKLLVADTVQSGVYTLRLGPPPGPSQSFAVNVDTVESDLAPLDPETLRNEVWPGIPFVHRTSWQDAGRPQAMGPRHGHVGLPAVLLYAVLGLLFLEILLAWRFGRYAV
jgi:hypothetical protein